MTWRITRKGENKRKYRETKKVIEEANKVVSTTKMNQNKSKTSFDEERKRK